MKTAAKISALLASCALAACSMVDVKTDYDHSTSFAKYKSYVLSPTPGGQSLSPSAQATLASSLKTQLALRGIHQSTHGKADLAVVPVAFLQDKVSVHQYTDWGSAGYGTMGYGYGSYGMWAGAPRTYTNVNQYTEGTLILDFVDTHTHKLVFRGTGQAVVGSQQGNLRKIEKAVEKIVAAFPAGPAQ